MTLQQRRLFNKIAAIEDTLAQDWQSRCLKCPHMSNAERRNAEVELNALRTKFKATFAK